ncbi:dihydroxyacetone kinase subunit DhaL [Limimaricola cinnabarinus]|uniref:Putative dihydroxyacetone kinase, dihydroxyacetone binding subunit n=1 Tax=Limimaricola cinnabarinus LL-001 TaxID=1337093 RepID=U2Z6N5_9RHOB|nr:dihydroxyacetone kinase subunit DhaL [Limimaricola cinnabarinus]GAD56717.1 putative dihydroxyacetone kinase, dihydroxyacetone binding subunit [Limimaricola cinnabarinus LL-001]
MMDSSDVNTRTGLAMQRFFNDPDDIVDETVAGFVKAHGDLIRKDPTNPRVVLSRFAPQEGRVGIVTGGGSGHEPAFIGYAGRNMVDAVAVGELFSSPTAQAFADAIRAADGGAGVAVLYGNYAGDNMNVKMARDMVAEDGIEVALVVANDDVCSAPPSERAKRRGVAGEIFMWKIGGARAALGGDLAQVQAAAQKAIDACRSVGVGLGPCTLPAVGHPNFQIAAGTMEVGIGHHGEPGARVEPLKRADDIADDMLRIVLEDQDLKAGTEVAVLVSGLGATPVNELYVLFDRIETGLEGAGLKVHRAIVGNYFTSLEMVGATLTVMALDDELKELLDVECASPGMSLSGAPVQPIAATSAPRTRRSGAAKAEAAIERAPEAVGDPRLDMHAASGIVTDLATVIVANKAYLSEIDGLIGDGDHGINMAKGFGRAAERIAGQNLTLDEALSVLSDVLMTEIGGSMGPLYGFMFGNMARAIEGRQAIDAEGFGVMLRAGLQGVRTTGAAELGDKTLVDCLVPAISAYEATRPDGFENALMAMAQAAEEGRDSTIDMVARLGRASRLGERSRGVLDAGATSCALILTKLADSVATRLSRT